MIATAKELPSRPRENSWPESVTEVPPGKIVMLGLAASSDGLLENVTPLKMKAPTATAELPIFLGEEALKIVLEAAGALAVSEPRLLWSQYFFQLSSHTLTKSRGFHPSRVIDPLSLSESCILKTGRSQYKSFIFNS